MGWVAHRAHARRRAGRAGATLGAGQLPGERQRPRPPRRHAAAPRAQLRPGDADRQGAALRRRSRRRHPRAAPVPSEAGVPTPGADALPTAPSSPCAGAHNFGGPENRFGAPATGHIHQGQDVLTAEGTPVLAPLAGHDRIDQLPGRRGRLLRRRAHRRGLRLHVRPLRGRLASPSAPARPWPPGSCSASAGQTGDATAPHLHFEMWVGGWQAAGGHPIDPLPYLEAWEHG